MEHPGSVDGDWYVDSRCIDCDVARQYAPELIATAPDGNSIIVRQPATPAEELVMWRATLACPTQSIGTHQRRRPPPNVFPWELDDGVFLCGYNDESSFGAHSYFVRRPEGNLLVDAPRWTRRLVEPLEAMGGIAHVLLSHRDDVADAQRYADHFGARVWIHEADRNAAPFATDVVTGDAPVELRPGLVIVPVPGHTRGSVCYSLEDRFLFSGDSLAWHRRRDELVVFGSTTWYSWDALTESMARLSRTVRFEWVLPGRGIWHHAPAAVMGVALTNLAGEMARYDARSWDRRRR